MAAHAVKFKTSGQVNRAVMFADDDHQTDTLHVDGDASGSRFRFTGTEDIGNGMTAGVQMEIETQSNDSFNATIRQNGSAGDKVGIRHAQVYFSGNFGKLSIGQSSDALDGIAFADLNNAWIAVENASDFGGSIDFVDSAGGSGVFSAGDVTPSFDGGRRDRIRYDTPSIGPLSLAVSHSADSQVDVGGKLAGSFAAGAYDLRVGYRNHDAGGQDDGTFLISGAFKAAMGLSIAGAWGSKSDAFGSGSDDAEYWYIKGGYDWGNNSVAIDYKASEAVVADAACSGGNVNVSACGGNSFGIGGVHTMPKAAIDLYAGYRFFELEDTGPSQNVGDISVFFVGSRIKFN
jgi:predicted porin